MLAFKHTTAAVLVATGPCSLYAVTLAGAADAATCTIYDNTAGNGTVAVKLRALTGETVCWQPSRPLSMNKGICVALTGTTPDISVAYG
jgi:hypothetical protein